MTEPCADNIDLYAGLQKVNRGGVSKYVRGYARAMDGMSIGMLAEMPRCEPLYDFVDAEPG